MRWVTSDTHFSHANIINLCRRPFKDVDEMNEALIENWNAVVADDDVVYHLGDWGLGPWATWEPIGRRLNGHKILVVGNHDRVFSVGNKPAQVARFMDVYNQWFEEIHGNLIGIEFAGRIVNMSHFPYDGDHFDGDRFTEARLADDASILIHGHTHLDQVFSRSKAGTLQIHVGQDAWGFTPVSEDQIEILIDSQE